MSTNSTDAATESLDVTIGRRIHQLMWDRQLTQTTFGPRIGMSQNTLTRKLRGQRGWSADEIAAAARTLHVPVGYLFGELPELDSNQQPAALLPAAQFRERATRQGGWPQPMVLVPSGPIAPVLPLIPRGICPRPPRAA